MVLCPQRHGTRRRQDSTNNGVKSEGAPFKLELKSRAAKGRRLRRTALDGMGDRMHVGRYVDGRELTFDQQSGQFAVGGTPVPLEQVLEYDDFAQILWANDELGLATSRSG